MSRTEKEITLDQLKPGDVMVMQGAQDVSWVKIIADGDMDAALIQAIMWLTDSDVCHGAIYYGDSKNIHSLIDDGEKGVGQHGMTHEAGQGDWWYIRRMDNQSLQPVLKLAMKYKNQPTAYDWELLTLLGLLLIYKKISPNTVFYRSLLLILEKLVVYLDRLTHKKSVDYFVCSQFVAACFDEAGSTYELQVKNGSLTTDSQSAEVSVLDHCIGYTESAKGEAVGSHGVSTDALTVEDIQLLLNTSQSQPIEASDLSADNGRMTAACDDFLRLFFQLNGASLGLSEGAYDTTSKRLELAQKFQADFVTPADLKSHCTNLNPIGMIQFVYGKAMP